MLRELTVNFEEKAERTREELVTDAILYLEHIRMGMGDTLAMTAVIKDGIERAKFNWSDIGITPEELQEQVEKFVKNARNENYGRMEKFDDKFFEILQFLNSATRV